MKNNSHIKFLGCDAKSHYIFNKKQKEIIKISRGNMIGWYQAIEPYDWFVKNFPKKKNSESFNKKAVREWIRSQSNKKGNYVEPENKQKPQEAEINDAF